jgi:flagellar L-ring protein precursor FlgH
LAAAAQQRRLAGIQRNEAVTIRLAGGVVTQVLPNGNAWWCRRGGVRVNSELPRAAGDRSVIRPQDIASDSTVLHDRMAEARIAYGRRGTRSRHALGSAELMDILLPF